MRKIDLKKEMAYLYTFTAQVNVFELNFLIRQLTNYLDRGKEFEKIVFLKKSAYCLIFKIGSLSIYETGSLLE